MQQLAGFSQDELLALLKPAQETITELGKSKEIDPDDFVMDCKCPKCGFEFDND